MVIGGKTDQNGNGTCSILPIKKHDDEKRCNENGKVEDGGETRIELTLSSISR